MEINGYIKNQDEVEVTLSITMTLKEWKDLQKDLPERWPHWKIGSAITDAVFKIGTRVSEEIKQN